MKLIIDLHKAQKIFAGTHTSSSSHILEKVENSHGNL